MRLSRVVCNGVYEVLAGKCEPSVGSKRAESGLSGSDMVACAPLVVTSAILGATSTPTLKVRVAFLPCLSPISLSHHNVFYGRWMGTAAPAGAGPRNAGMQHLACY